MFLLNYLQRIGRALMVPVATLPAAAILMGVGYWIDPISWGENNAFAALLLKSGSAIIENMPVLFAIGVAYGMSSDKEGAAALTGFIAFLIVTSLCAPDAVSLIRNVPLEEVSSAFDHINNQFVGILSGVIAAEMYNRFSHVELPKAFSFFNGRRIVPILTSFLMLFVAVILMYIWPLIFDLLVAFGESIQNLGSWGAGIYAFFNRLLIPIGLHHALNSVFWFDVAGINDIPNFLAGQLAIDSGDAIVGITGRYQAGFFPIMMFGLPGAALAIVKCARPENRAKIGSIMLAAGFASFFTGITEPLEFAFMFVAPLLFVIHAVLTGISVFIAAQMQWIAGFGFSAGLIDLILSSRNPLAVQWFMLLLQGLLFFALYYLVFRITITRFNLTTPGREADKGSREKVQNLALKQSAKEYIQALGGVSNISSIDACITRLRLTLQDTGLVDDETLKQLGAAAVIILNHTHVHVVVGTRAELLGEEMRHQCLVTAMKDVHR